MRRLFRALAAVVLILLAPAAAADSHLSSDPVVAAARESVERGRFDAALEILRALDPAGADRVDILFLTGLAAVGAAERRADEDARRGLLDEAIDALRAILVDRPELVRVRLELARVFFLKGEDDLAREHFERILSAGVDPGVASNIERFLAAIRERRRWVVYLGGALAPDSNLGSVSEQEVIHIDTPFGRLPFRRDDPEAESGVGVVVWGGGEYQYPLTSALRLRAGADAARHEYARGDFDRFAGAVHIGPRWLIDERTEASLLALADRQWLGTTPYLDSLGARFEVNRRLARWLFAQAGASWRDRDYRALDFVDGPTLSLSAGATMFPSSTVRLFVDAGWHRERARVEPWRNTRRSARANVSVALPWGFTVGVGAEFAATRYRPGWGWYVPDGGARKDRTRVLTATVLNRAFTLFGFSPELVAVNERRDSNAQLYDYRRNRAELRLRRLF